MVYKIKLRRKQSKVLTNEKKEVDSIKEIRYPGTKLLSKHDIPPCQAKCPIHQNVRDYIAYIAAGKYEEALDIILEDNPIPKVVGRVCRHPCEDVCIRVDVEDTISICNLKRFVADKVGNYDLPKPGEERSEKVAIIGSGPAGLMCAYDLRRRGYKVDIYEALPVAGGMLATGIPDYRLPKDLLEEEIQRLEDQGIKIKLETLVGGEIPLSKLRKDCDAVFIAVGAHKERKMDIPGEGLSGVISGIEFLRNVNLGRNEIELGNKVVVVGGGNSAVDAARVANRMAEEVTIVYRRGREQMPASEEEIEEALDEGVEIKFLTNPIEILGDEKVEGVKCIKMELGKPDESGRRRPIPIDGSEHEISCDNVIISIGQTPSLSPMASEDFEVSEAGTLQVDDTTLQTEVDGVFAGGDCVTGPDTVVAAMGAGRRAAESIHRFINGLDMYENRQLEKPFESLMEIDVEGEPIIERKSMPKLNSSERSGFEEVNLGLEEIAKEEADRCLYCDRFHDTAVEVEEMEDLITPGALSCLGCNAELALRFTMRVIGNNTILAIPPGCMGAAGIVGWGINTGAKVPVFFPLLTNSASMLAGIKEHYKREGKDVNVVGFIGDGGTADVGFQALSGAAERGENIIYIQYDNEGYMNTGVQRSGTTPRFAQTKTTPVGKIKRGKEQVRKSMALIMVMHDIPYVATANMAFPDDFRRKIERAKEIDDGMAFIDLFSPCQTGWDYPPEKNMEVNRLAVETNLRPLWRCDHGELRLTHEMEGRRPIKEYTDLVGKFSHLTDEEIEEFQEIVDRKYQRIKDLASVTRRRF